jgi:hypothetical protein
MELKEIKTRIDNIKAVSGDDEVAHIEEDALREDFIKYIAIGGNVTSEMAKEVLKTNDIDFARWCA